MTTSPATRTLVLLVRHGQTPTTGLVLPGRAAGLHLSEAGRAQAQQVAERFRGLEVTALYTSPLERARETAAPTASALGLEAVVDDGLAECDFGEWTGAQLSDLAQRAEWQQVQQAPSTFRFPGGESFTELHGRIVATVDRLRDAHPGGIVVCFSHADPIRVALAHALGTPLDLFQRLQVGTASVSAIAFSPGVGPSVPLVNSTLDPLAGLGG